MDIREDAIGILVNPDSEHLDFTDVNEKTYPGLFLPDIANDIQYYNEEEFVVIDYGKAIFAIKEAVITYYTSPLNPDLGIGEEHQDQEQIAGLVTKYYFYRVFNNPGINQGALVNLFVNLFNNVVNHAIEGKKIRLQSVELEKYWQIKIIDFGKGISQKAKNEVLNYNNQRKNLGLAICIRIIKLHNGKMWIEDNLGGGTLINILLPKINVI
ncbi:MAG: Adaptive-response sensory-kinase SasA [Candidatus Heimdallarchaeota archaeon LC_3]|nr:MAG: Adaptive-response sensory-kinase SasA [Candidatus Heimdallarchaeota archaeon LC_3]